MKYIDYYHVLDVAKDASLDDIKKAYRKLARKYHPDLSKDKSTETQFKELAEAYATLKDPEKRSAYDALGSSPNGADFSPPPQWSNTYTNGQSSFDEMNLADLLAALHSQPRHTAYTAHPQRGQNYEDTVAISMLESLTGTHLHLQLMEQGKPKKLDVTIPAGVRQGQKIRLAGMGGKGIHGGTNGDIYLHVQLKPHDVFRPAGSDLYFDLALTPWECVIGTEIAVPTLQDPVLLTIPAGTRNGQKLRLKGRGLPISKTDRGDLLAVVHLEIPQQISVQELELYQQMAKLSTFNPRQKLMEPYQGHYS